MTDTTGRSIAGMDECPPCAPEKAVASLVYSTFPDIGSAKTAARALVDSRLAACVNIVPGVVSIYRWKDAIEEDAECAVLVKTRRALVPAVMATIRANHPYETPALVAYDIAAASPDYLAWIEESTVRAGT